MAAPGPREPMAKIADVIGSYRPTRLFRPSQEHVSITSLDFDDSGELLLAASDDETIQIYSCKDGKHVKTLFSKKYGVHLARFTHHSQSVLYSSTKGDATIRYLSTHDNQYIRYFKGHTATVTSLELSPASDSFISCSVDNTVKLWSLGTPNPTGTLELHGAHLAAFDPSGSVLAIASYLALTVLLYDVRNFDKAPFAAFDLSHQDYKPSAASAETWTKLEFSNDGRSILLSTNGLGHYLLDAFSGSLKATLSRRRGPTDRLAPGAPPSTSGSAFAQSQGDTCLTPDGRFVLGGAGKRNLLVWDAHAEPAPGLERSIAPVHELDCKSRTAVAAFNPRLNLFVGADKEVVFWVPEKNGGPE
ncbi:MAG: member of Set1p complex, histone methyl transferase [Thelocarpon impressellum]|nr:MAG: member of Set1p complex, histone methyl transferase [Thelocarpon impressellum]